MKNIVIPEDDLQRLERRFGPDVRRMGPWNSDGVFGYLSVSMGSVEVAAETVCQPGLPEAVSRLKESREPVAAFVDLMNAFGSELVVHIRAAYSESSVTLPSRHPPASSKLAVARQSAA